MGNSEAKDNPETESVTPLDIPAIVNETGFSAEEVTNWIAEFKKVAPKDGKGFDKVSFPLGLQKVGLLDHLSTASTKTYEKRDGTRVTLQLNVEEVKRDLVETLWGIFDSDNSGRVEFRELLLGTAIVMKGDIAQKAKAMFNLHDADKSGTLTRDELHKSLQKTMRSLNKTVHASRKQLEHELGKAAAEHYAKVADQMASDQVIGAIVKKIFSEADTDNSGEVSLDEFVEFSKKNPETLKPLFQLGGEEVPPPAE